MNTKQQFLELLSNPQIEPSILSLVLEGLTKYGVGYIDRSIFDIVAVNPMLPFKQWLNVLTIDGVLAFKNPMIELALLENPTVFNNLNADEYDALLSYDFNKFYKIAMNNLTDFNFLLKHIALTPEVINSLYQQFKHIGGFCFFLVAEYRDIPISVLEELSDSSGIEMKKAVLQNPHCTHEIFKKLKKEPELKDFAIVCDPDIEAKELLIITSDSDDATVLDKIVYHQKVTKKILKTMQLKPIPQWLQDRISHKLKDFEDFGSFKDQMYYKHDLLQQRKQVAASGKMFPKWRTKSKKKK